MQQPRTLAPRDALRLQGVINNRAMTELLRGGAPGASRTAAKEDSAAPVLPASEALLQEMPEQEASAMEAQANGGEPDQERPDEAPTVRAVEVTSVIRGGSDISETREGGFTPSPGTILAQQASRPGRDSYGGCRRWERLYSGQ